MRIYLLGALALCMISIPAFADEVITLELETPGFERPAPQVKGKQSPNTVKSTVTSSSTKAKPTKFIGRVALVTVDDSRIYAKQSSQSRVYSVCKKDTPIAVISDGGSWHGVLMIDGSTGWIESKRVKLLDYGVTPQIKPRGNVASRGDYDVRGYGSPVIQEAVKYLGVPYVFGGTNPNSGIDCSAYVRKVFAEFGVSLPRVARDQAKVGTSVGWNDLQAGDRLYFSCKHSYVDHCGIYIGDGYFIHASASHGQVAVDNLANKFYSSNLVVAMRS